MRRSIVLLLLLSFCEPASAKDSPPKSVGRIVLFGANWCAPCMVELRKLDLIVTLAGTRRVVIAWLDQAPDLPLQSDRRTFDVLSPKSARAMYRSYGEGNAGVPLTVALDSRDRRCGIVNAPLTGEAIGKLLSGCKD